MQNQHGHVLQWSVPSGTSLIAITAPSTVHHLAQAFKASRLTSDGHDLPAVFPKHKQPEGQMTKSSLCSFLRDAVVQELEVVHWLLSYVNKLDACVDPQPAA